MFHPDEYWRTILARPHDDAPRLVYADWLEERGEPLAEFIRLQCRLARENAERDDLVLERREVELLGTHGPLWAEAVADHVDWWCFRRGFVGEVALSEEQLAGAAADLFRHAPLEDLHLTPGDDLSRLPRVPELARTVFLDLSAHELGDAHLTRLADAPFLSQVHGLNLSSCVLSDAGVHALAGSPHTARLRELYLCDNLVSDDGVRALALSPLLERLEVLYLRDNPITPEGGQLLQRVLGERVHL